MGCLQKIKRSQVIVAVIALVVGYVWVRGFWFTEVFHTHKSNEPNRAALLQIQAAIPIGASRDEVLTSYWRHRTDSLKLFADRPTDWIITMPQEFGASDWKLLVEFQDGKVKTLRVRKSDGPRPQDGSVDKQ